MPKVLVRECLPKKDVPHIFTTEISPISSKRSFHESVLPPTSPDSPLMVIFLILIEECNALLARCPFYMHVTMGTKLRLLVAKLEITVCHRSGKIYIYINIKKNHAHHTIM